MLVREKYINKTKQIDKIGKNAAKRIQGISETTQEREFEDDDRCETGTSPFSEIRLV